MTFGVVDETTDNKGRNEGSREEFPLRMLDSSCAFSLSSRIVKLNKKLDFVLNRKCTNLALTLAMRPGTERNIGE